jgi:hypothetical protein
MRRPPRSPFFTSRAARKIVVMEDSFTIGKRPWFHTYSLTGIEPATRAKPTSKDDGEPSRNQANLGRARLTRLAVDAKGRIAG